MMMICQIVVSCYHPSMDIFHFLVDGREGNGVDGQYGIHPKEMVLMVNMAFSLRIWC